MMQPRSVGVEQVGLFALIELGLIDTLSDLGVRGRAGVDHRQSDRENGAAGFRTGDLELATAAQRPG
jgi:hypothetical protein